MKRPPLLHRLGETAPAEDTYTLIDLSGKALNFSLRCREGERLPVVAVAGFRPIGYVRVGEAAQAA